MYSLCHQLLFEQYILTKAMPMYLRTHLEENHFIATLPRGQSNNYLRH